jgi:hypothetical protein
LIVFNVPLSAAASNAFAAAWKLCSLPVKSGQFCQISGLAPVLPSSRPVPWEPARCLAREVAMVAAADADRGEVGRTPAVRGEHLVASPIVLHALMPLVHDLAAPGRGSERQRSGHMR